MIFFRKLFIHTKWPFHWAAILYSLQAPQSPGLWSGALWLKIYCTPDRCSFSVSKCRLNVIISLLSGPSYPHTLRTPQNSDKQTILLYKRNRVISNTEIALFSFQSVDLQPKVWYNRIRYKNLKRGADNEHCDM